MSVTGKNFAEQGSVKAVSIGVGINSGFNREAFVEALFNGAPNDKVLAPMKNYAEAEKSPSKLFMNMIEKGLDIGAHKEIAAGNNEDVKAENAKIVNMNRAPTAIEIQMHKSSKVNSA